MTASTCCAIFSALLTRFLFCVHTVITVWRVVVVYENDLYWCITAGLGFLLIETLVTLIKRKGQEWKWICPSFLVYLCCTLPAMCLLEVDKLRDRRDAMLNNETMVFTAEQQNVSIAGLDISIEISADTWTLILEQVLLLLLIVGRWMLPKGDISRDELSQLLFVYIGMASDIIDFSTLFDEDAILQNVDLGLSILIFWAISLMQYAIVTTSTKAKKTIASDLQSTRERADAGEEKSTCACLETEIWAIMTIVVMQDLPFLILRLYTIVAYQVVNYTIIFFTCKNALIVVLQFYRIAVIVSDMRNKVETNDETPDYITSYGENNIPVDNINIQEALRNEYELAVKYPKKKNKNDPVVIKIQLI